MPSPLRRKPREIPEDLVHLGLALFWGFGILGSAVYLIECYSLGTSLLSGREIPAVLAKGFSIFDFCFLLAIGLNYLLSARHKFQRIASLLSGLLGGLVLKDIFVLANSGSTFFVALSFLFSVPTAVIVYNLFKRLYQDVPLTEMEIPPTDYGSSPLQVDAEGKVLIPSKSCEYHVEVLGGTGTGKTHRVVKPFIRQDIVNNRIGCFIYDAKSENTAQIVFYVEEAGREKEFRYFDLERVKYSMTWNPLYSGTPDEIANKVFTGLYYDKDRGNPYYADLASAFLHNLVSLIKMELSVLTFKDLFSATSEVDTFKTINRLCQKYPNTDQARYFSSNWLLKPIRQRQEELTGLINKLQRFCNREWAPLINSREPEIKMEEVFEFNQILLFGVASIKNGEDARALSIMAIMDVAQQISNRFQKRPPKTFRVYLDEFAHLAYPGFIDTLNLAREGRVSFVLAHQSIADLAKVSIEFARQVDINTRNKVILRQDSSDSAEFFSRLLGTEEEITSTYSYDTRSTLFKTASGVTEKQEHKFRFNPNVLKQLPDGEGVVRLAFPEAPIIRRVHLQEAKNPLPGFKLEKALKERNHQMEKKEMATSVERLDLLQERKYQEPENPTIKGLDEKYSRGRKTPKRI